LTIDGRQWLEYEVSCRVENIPFSYLFHVYSGPEGSYQVVGWTFQNLFPANRAKMREVAESFRFPPAKPAAAK
jgi:hypothetical protein